ncbi:MAG: serine hydrolase [Candidatus Spechtbacterales bacterium]
MKIKKINSPLVNKVLKQLKDKNPKVLGILGVVVSIPVLVSLVFFYGNLNFNDLFASLTFQDAENTELENTNTQKNSEFRLKLIPQDEFLKQYNPKPALLPKPIQMNATLSGFLRSNPAMELLPTRNWAIPFEDIDAASALAIEMPTRRILYGKDVFTVRPIASITKLATALTAYESMSLDEVVTISQSAIRTEGAAGGLVVGEKLTVEQLLYALLLESSNDASVALLEHYNETKSEGSLDFISLMNHKMRKLDISDTYFEEPTGLSPQNISSANSIAKILYTVSQNEKLASIMASSSYATQTQGKEMVHYWINLNTLLEAYEGVIGGKTGYTEEAGPSMSIVLRTPNESRYLMVVVLNASDRVQETTRLLKWVKKAYIWEE